MPDNDIPSVSSEQFVKALLTFDFVKRTRTKTQVSLSRNDLSRRVIIRIDKPKVLPIIVKNTLAMAGISKADFIEALKKSGGKK